MWGGALGMGDLKDSLEEVRRQGAEKLHHLK